LKLLLFLFRLALGRRLPVTTGTLTVPALRGPVSICRDRWGIPTIQAEHDVDAWFGLGFCHGQDRTFQLDLLLRTARGTLSELVGAAALPIDRLVRRVGFLWSAKAQMSALDADVLEMIEGYAAGVSAGNTVGLSRLPHEYALLGGRPGAWTSLDALAMLKLQSFVLVSNWDAELARYMMLTRDGPEALAALEPTYPEWLAVTAPPGATAGPVIERLSEEIAALNGVLRLGGGSNNWALAATRTRTGRPILANDPHLPPGMPPHWYLAHVRTPRWAVAGASFVGGPAFPAGHNGHGAWGVTVGMVDNTDLFLEELGPDGRSVRRGDRFEPCETRVETIAVKGAAEVEELVVQTPHGPLISPTLGDISLALSMRATWMDPLRVRGLLACHRAGNFDEFRQCFADWPALAFNMVYADAAGDIGWQMAGLAPRRRKGHGLLPLPGWDTETGWHADAVPFEEMPSLKNPTCGYVATANNQPVADGTGPYLGMDWADGYRASLIVEALDKRNDWDVAAVMALQLDLRAMPWDEIRYAVLSPPTDDRDAGLAQEMLWSWDGQVAADSPAAAIYELFLALMSARVSRSKAPNSQEWAMGRGITPLVPSGLFGVRRVGHLVRLMREQPAGWFDRSWPEEIVDALATVVRQLRTEQGNDPRRWAWGRIRPLVLRHPLGRRWPLDAIFNVGPIPLGGDANTIAQAAVDPLEPTGDVGFFGSLRMVVDLADCSASRFILPGGQSGNPLSPHYEDQLALWKRGEGVPIAWTEAEIEQTTSQTLHLVPHG
jgi:penicillin amidase